MISLDDYYAEKRKKTIDAAKIPKDWEEWPSYIQIESIKILKSSKQQKHPKLISNLIQKAHPETLTFLNNDIPSELQRYLTQAQSEVALGNQTERERYDTFIKTATKPDDSQTIKKSIALNRRLASRKSTLDKGNEAQKRAEEQLIEQFHNLSFDEQVLALQSHRISEDKKELLFIHAKTKARKNYFESLVSDDKKLALINKQLENIEQEKLPKAMMMTRAILLTGLILGITASLVFPPAGLGIMGIGVISVLAFKVSDIMSYAIGGFFEKNAIRRAKLFREMQKKMTDLFIMITFGVSLFFAGPAVLSMLIPAAITYMVMSTVGSILTLISQGLRSFKQNISAKEKPLLYQFIHFFEKSLHTLGFSLSHPIEVTVSTIMRMLYKTSHDDSIIKADKFRKGFMKAISDGLFALFRPVTETIAFGQESLKYLTQKNNKRETTEMIKNQAIKQLELINSDGQNEIQRTKELKYIISNCDKKPKLSELKNHFKILNTNRNTKNLSASKISKPDHSSLKDQSNTTFCTHTNTYDKNTLDNLGTDDKINQQDDNKIIHTIQSKKYISQKESKKNTTEPPENRIT